MYINYCYNIDAFMKETENLKELYRQKGIYKNMKQAFLKKNPNYTKEDLVNNPSLFPNPTISKGILSKIVLDPV